MRLFSSAWRRIVRRGLDQLHLAALAVYLNGSPASSYLARYDTLGGGGVSADSQSDKARESARKPEKKDSSADNFATSGQDVEMLVGVNPSTYISQ